jgi:nucleoid-associated protein EbfC
MVGFGDLANIMSKVQGLQANMKKMQEELASTIVQGDSGGGMVRAKMNGKFELLELKIDSQTVDIKDIEMLEDLVVAAVNAAVARNQEQLKKKMAEVTGGLNIPGLDKLGGMLGLG